MDRRRSRLVALGMTAMLAASTTGCGLSTDESDALPDHTGICVDRSTGIRLDDAVCAADRIPPSPAPTDNPTTSPTPPPTTAVPTTHCTPVSAPPTPPTAGTSTTSEPSDTAATAPTPCPPGQALADRPESSGATSNPYRSHGWYFIPWGSSAPAVGSTAHGGTFSEPLQGSSRVGGVSAAGGKVSEASFSKAKSSIVRGGFGSSGSKGGS
ncbi:hypothetical protein SAMN05421595_0948 [Austwickia chelonae]|uniref:Lipoprotein n=1 Tax=Austwickia chelonae NBRC 105200 TaxID=1184607 RepID=K6V4Q6_9MICO|nr:hypothetical protein [Austwickia chelonae]GAB77133.1 hypothetical protein AUCHE_05_00380 [Austwickia chelonae NBRC 105200]SEW03484.1 hypothetical protein SAMN05421595_0948 [Austwickia chelonae]